jgi:uncharacterized protein involved in exopolysaccharide biosynthesis
MSIFQFLRIFWAHRWIPIVTTVSCFIGALIVVLIVPPRYEATSRVMLNLLKPDQVTGEVIGTRSSRLFVETEMERIKDFGVTGKVVDQLGWANDPELIAQYQGTGAQTVDIRQWLGQRVAEGISVKTASGANILEISYRSPSPETARQMADAVREAYMTSTLERRRAEASRNADWYTEQAAKVQQQLTAADEVKTAYERENGIVMQADNTDVDTARLRALAGQGAGVSIASPAVAAMATASEIQLAQLDAQAAQLSKTLGPNHPQMAELAARRATLAQLAAQERSSQRSAAAAVSSNAAATAAAIDEAVKSQTSRVIAKRDKIQHLSQLQAEVNLKRDQYNRTAARAAELRQEAAVMDSGLTPMGNAATPRKATFPNIPLILGGAVGLGFGLGILISLLVELLGRRVRSAEDMHSAFDVPLVAIVRPPESGAAKRRRRFDFGALIGKAARA